MKKLFYISILLFTLIHTTSFGQGVQLVKDFAPGTDHGMYDGKIISSYGGSILIEFYADGQPNTLFKSNGTEAGTHEVYGLGGSGYVTKYLNVDSSIYVIAKISSSKYSLLKFNDNTSMPQVILS